MLKKYIYILMALLLAVLPSCIDDSITTSPAHQPSFSTDTLRMGVVFTDEPSATHRFVVYNPHGKGLNISSIELSGENASMFRLNVDGMTGRTFSNVEIRANDSIYVFVSVNIPHTGLPEAQDVDAALGFTVNGYRNTVVLCAQGQDVRRLKGVTLAEDTVLTEGAPYQVTDSLVVAPGATLTLEPGARLLFHDNARLVVRGTLRSLGTADKPVRLTGDRRGNVITDVTFDLMSRQWYGVEIMPEAVGSYMEYTDISNTSYGVAVYGSPESLSDEGAEPHLAMVNTRIRNSGCSNLTAVGASVEAYGCEFSDAAMHLVHLVGGSHRFDRCTAANYYLFAPVMGASWCFESYYPSEDTPDEEALPPRATVTNSISYGRGADVVPGDLTGLDVYFLRCLFKSAGTDDDNFKDSVWDTDPMFYTVREEYLFDYRLKPESPAIDAAYTSLSQHPLGVDYYGVPYRSELGAYAFVPEAR